MTTPTPLFFYVLYASPFFIAALVLAYAKYASWRAERTSDTIEKPISKREDIDVEESDTMPVRRPYMSYASAC